MKLEWDKEARAKLKRVPFFLRGMVQGKVEEYVAELGKTVVTAGDVDAARQRLMPGGPSSADEGGTIPDEALQSLLDRAETDVEQLEHHTRFYHVRPCAGATGCPLTVVDSRALADRLAAVMEARDVAGRKAAALKGPILSHQRFKVSVAGCPNGCPEPHIKDFGIIGRARVVVGPGECTGCQRCVRACPDAAIAVADKQPVIDRDRCLDCGRCAQVCPTEALVIEATGYSVLVGGKLGRHPQLAREWIPWTDEAGVERAFEAALDLWLSEDGHGERLGAILERVGWEALINE